MDLNGGWGHRHVECLDRIAVQMTELTLRPVRLLRDQSSLAAVTLRASAGGRRFQITVRKRWPGGAGQEPAYRWDIVEVEGDGTAKPGGAAWDGPPPPAAAHADPEEAYWAAVAAMTAATGPLRG